MGKNIKAVSVGDCWFCDWKTVDSKPDLRLVDGAVYVFCPKCGFEIPDARYLIGENVEE